MALWTAANMSTLSSAIMRPSQPAPDPAKMSSGFSITNPAHAEEVPLVVEQAAQNALCGIQHRLMTCQGCANFLVTGKCAAVFL